MSTKRVMEMQGASDRGLGDGMTDGDKPRQATAAQLARRKIIQPKGRASGRNSRQASPAVTSFTQQQQPFQPPPSTNGFNFSFGSNNTPSFTGAPTPQNSNPSFSFGATQPEAPQNGGNMFGSGANTTSSFSGGGFGSASGQSQSNGFGNTGSTAFDQGNKAPAATSTFNFGQGTAQSSQTNGFGATANNMFGGFKSDTNGSNATPSFNFGAAKPQEQPQFTGGFSFGASQPAQAKESTPSFTFGAAQPAPTKEATPSFSFGASSQQEAPKPNAPTFSFGTTTSQPEKSNSTAAPFSFSSSAQPTSSAASSNPFAANNGEKKTEEGNKAGLFGSTSTPAGSTAPASSGGVFNTTNTPKPNGAGVSLFTPDESVKPPQRNAPAFSFGSQTPAASTQEASKPSSNLFNMAQSDSTSAAEQTPKPANLFAAAQSQPASGSLFNFGQAAPQKSVAQESEPSRPFAGFGQASADQSSAAKPPLADSEDASMTTPEQTPRKAGSDNVSTNAFAASGANLGKSLFDRMEPKVANAFRPPQEPESAAPESNHHIPSSAPATGETKELFARISRADPPSISQPTLNTTSAPPVVDAGPEPSKFAASVMSGSKQTASDRQGTFNAFRSLNLGIRGHLATQDHDVDWTPIFRYYMWEASRINSESQPPQSSINNSIQSSSHFSKDGPGAAIDFTATPKASSTTTGFSAQTPNMFSAARAVEPPATAPVTRKTHVEDSRSGAPPATEKGNKFADSVAYPRLPDTASKTARLFASTLDSSASGGAETSERAGTPQFGPPDDLLAKVRGDAAKKAEAKESFNPSTTSIFAKSNNSTTTNSIFDKANSGSTLSSSSSTFTGFKPSNSSGAASSNTAESSAPAFGFKPVLSSATAGGSAFAAFGAKAKADAEKERQKRKMEDYDSEEENEAEWEARDKAAQEEKRRKIEEAAKQAPGFKFQPSTSGVTSSAPAFTFGSSTPSTAPKASSTSLFGPKAPDADKASGEKAQGSGDHTWKPETPIKFGGSNMASTTPAAAPPANPFGGLFGASAPTSNPVSEKPAPATLGFNFGYLKGTSVNTSRATTPGVTTDGETSTAADSTVDTEGDPADEPRDKQIEDMTALLDEEKAENEVLFETSMSKAVKMDERKTENGYEAAWVEKGKGPLYILKNKTTGKARVLLKVPPLGREAMNFAPLKGAEYRLAPGKNKIVQGMFVDHLARDKDKAGKPSMWTLQVRQPSEASEIVRILNEHRS